MMDTLIIILFAVIVVLQIISFFVKKGGDLNGVKREIIDENRGNIKTLGDI